MGYIGISQITFIPSALMESSLGIIPARSLDVLKARSFISYIEISEVAGTFTKGVSYCGGSGMITKGGVVDEVVVDSFLVQPVPSKKKTTRQENVCTTNILNFILNFY